MGYRSDVRILTSKKGYERLQKYVKQALKNENGWDDLLENADIRNVSSNGVLVGWNCIKWYEDYKDVNSIVEGLEVLENEDYSYRFSRIGEDFTDHEEIYYDSKNRGDHFIPFPSVIRQFDDEYTLKDLSLCNEWKKRKEVEL